MAVLTYNGIVLPYTNITDYRCEVVYDDDGGVDALLWKYDIKGECVINMAYANLVAPHLISSPPDNIGIYNAAALQAIIRNKMRQHRKTLSLKFGDVELIPQKQQSNRGVVDAKNGPKPLEVNIIDLMNETFIVVFHIVAHYWETPRESGPAGVQYPIVNNDGHPILSNRWSETVEIDANKMTKYRRNGKFTIRSDNTQGRIADSFREQMAIVGIRPGMMRNQSTYSVSADGLTLKYDVDDIEFFKPPPPLATKAKGYYMESTSKWGAMRYGTVFLSLQAPKNISQAKLLRQCISICTTKLRANGAINLALIQAGYIKTDLYENSVECMLKVMANSPRSRVAGVPMTTDEIIVQSPESDNRSLISFETLPSTRGTQGILLRAAAYYDPSVTGTVMQIRGLADVGVANPLIPNDATYLPGDEVGTLGKTLET